MKTSLLKFQKTYLEAKEYLEILDELDYELKMQLAFHKPHVFIIFNEIAGFVEKCERLGLHLTFKKAD